MRRPRHLVAAVILVAVGAAGCAPRQNADPPRAFDPVVAACSGPLADWITLVGAALPGFAGDSLAKAAPEPFGWYDVRPSDPASPERKRREESLVEWSSDGRRYVDPDVYRDFDLDERGRLDVLREPDSAPAFGEAGRDSLWLLAFEGTSGRYEDARWLDRDRFVLFSWHEDADQDSLFFWRLSLIDLAGRTRTDYDTRRADTAAFERYRAAMDAWLRMRFDHLKPGRRS